MTGRRSMLDSAALAAVSIAHNRFGLDRFAITPRNPEREAYLRAVDLGWLWEPLDGWLAITADGVAALAPYRHERPADRCDQASPGALPDAPAGPAR
jgi:hypothetical protein